MSFEEGNWLGRHLELETPAVVHEGQTRAEVELSLLLSLKVGHVEMLIASLCHDDYWPEA